MKKFYPLFLLSCLFIPIICFAQKNKIFFRNTIKVEKNDGEQTILNKASHVIPSRNQLEALRNEFIAFVHIGPNTFTRMEWGTGKEDPQIFDLKELHTDQWCEAMKAAGMKMVILTVKHHDGFVLWQSRYTNHGIMSTHFQNGKGDILKSLSASCKKYGLKLGIYLSPADLYQMESPDGLYGNLSKKTERTIPREIQGRPFANKTKFKFVVDDYNEYFLNQLFELLTEYGPINEVWFDGAHPKHKGGQQYDYIAWKKLIRTLAPKAVIFGKEDIRWCGNEGGGTRNTEWNVIPYSANPDTMNMFKDLTSEDLGSRKILVSMTKPFYLHYQPAETNTSIREGWFYRDDINQQVRSADNVFDIYEHSVGGNSIFLLNIPPNRSGMFSKKDVKTLEETGKRIRETYDNNLMNDGIGPKKVLDNNNKTFILLKKQPMEFVISLPKVETINRIMIQEAIDVYGERVEKHAVDAWEDNQWKEISQATNIGYKRILRFPNVCTDKIRIRILKTRQVPVAISHVSAHYYKSRPPMLEAIRSLDGMVTINPQQNFKWNKQYIPDNSKNKDYLIYYTTDGSDPTTSSQLYKKPFFLENKELKAIAVSHNETGSVYRNIFGYIKKNWKVIDKSSEETTTPAISAFDENSGSYWMTEKGSGPGYLSIDLGKEYILKGFAYTPQRNNSEGMIEEGTIEISNDGQNWKTADNFKFGNLINDPTKRFHNFPTSITARYIRIKASIIASNGDTTSMAEFDLF